MQIEWLEFNRSLRITFILSISFFFSAPLSKAQVTSLSGTFTANVGSVPRFTSNFSSAINVQGPSFSLSGNFPCNAQIQASETNAIETVTFDPNLSVTEFAPAPPMCNTPPLPNSMTLVYEGQTYTSIGLTLNFVGLKAVVANTNACCMDLFDFFNGSVSGVAFSMTGLISVYQEGTLPGGTAPVLTIPISGLGVFGSRASGAGLGSGTGGLDETTTYQFWPSNAGFSADTTTQGAWIGNYGGDGYLIPTGASYLPSYAAVSVSQASIYTWASQSSDTRVLQSGPNATTGTASAYTSNSFDVNITFTDDYIHRVSLYLLDFDTTSRSEVLTITDVNTGAVLANQTITTFHNGVWASFDLQGTVRINVTSNGPGSAVVSGIFFGPGGVVGSTVPGTSAPIYFGSDSATMGAWLGLGSDGYLIANGPSMAPSNGSIEVVGAIPFTWAGQTTDPRALQIPKTSGLGIASAFTQYAGAGFTINVHVVNGPERLTLYFLDWDNEGRSESITITDLSTGTVLNNRTIANFQNGLYVTWLLGYFPGTSDVVITILPIGATTPVVSGIFFN